MTDEEGMADRARLELKIYKREKMFHYRAARSAAAGEITGGLGYIDGFPIGMGYNSTGVDRYLITEDAPNRLLRAVLMYRHCV